jgi:DNA-binding XRE family transcriptional regulator
MAKTLLDKLSEFPKRRHEKVMKRADTLIAEEMSLQDLRKALEFTQEDIAKHLHIRQEGVSRIEKRSDLLLTTLRGYIETMGGDLELVIRFPNRPPVILHGLGEIHAKRVAE